MTEIVVAQAIDSVDQYATKDMVNQSGVFSFGEVYSETRTHRFVDQMAAQTFCDEWNKQATKIGFQRRYQVAQMTV